jgi:cytochrome c-type biogenesis protein CcmF
MMIAETGHYALILALAVAIVQTVLPLWGTRTRDPKLMAVAVPSAQVQFVLIAISFAALTTAYVRSDFSLQNVWANSHSAKPLIYKIAGVWGNHEGSMVLWVLILALFGAAVATFGSNLPRELQANVLAVQGSIAAAFLLFIITTSNPFTRLDPAPLDGQGLNPVLQDPALAFHPPFLYTGYVGFSMAFSFAVAALIDGRIDAAWARWVRPWTLAAWMCLTLGIAMGSWWAYYELGWGGFWFWDPVENASFMPWLAGTALLHSALVMEKRDALKVWTILLAIITFSLSLMGTFLVRSGVLTSVHAFAVDPARGIFILAIMGLFIGGALVLFAIRAPLLAHGGLFAPISREGSLVLNNLLLTTTCAAVFVGTLYPLALESLTGEKISVGAPFFNFTFVPLIVPLLVAVPFGPMLAWKRGDLVAAWQRLMAAAVLALVAVVAFLAWQQTGPVACAVRHRARNLARRRCTVGNRLQGEAVRWLSGRSLPPPRQFAALGLRHGACSRWARHRGHRHCRHNGLAERKHSGAEAEGDRGYRRLPSHLRGCCAERGSELPGARRTVQGRARRSRRHGA